MSGTTADPTPTVSNQAPMQQQAMGNFDAMSPEQLQETVLKLKGSPQGQLAQQMLMRKRIMGSASGAPQQYALGGTLQPGGGVHFAERGVAPPSGLLHTAGPGRTDNLKVNPHADSYIIPADVVSGLGEGNSLAGAKMMDMALHSGPGGIQMPQGGGHKLIAPKPPAINSGFGASSAVSRGFGLAAGGNAPPVKVPVIAAGGEYCIEPDKCREIGGGDIKRGHRILDAFVKHIRKKTIKELSNLKGPVQS